MKKSFILHLDSLEILDELSDEQIAKLFKAFRSYHLGIEPELDQLLRIAFKPFKLQFERDAEKYEVTSNRNSLNGSKGGRPKKQENPVAFLGLDKKQPKAKKADSDSDSVSDSKSVNDNTFEQSVYQFEAKYGKPMIDAFYAYWTEADKKGKLRYQAEKFFDIGRRLTTWSNNNFHKNQNSQNREIPAEPVARKVHESFNL